MFNLDLLIITILQKVYIPTYIKIKNFINWTPSLPIILLKQI